MPRTQLPAWSPVSGAILARGAFEAARGGATDRLAALIRQEYGADRVVLMDSGTSALTMALRSLGPAPTVALPAYGCFDLATAAIGAGAKVRLYDLDPATLGPLDRSLSQVIEAGIDGLVLAHLYGIPAESTHWREVARERGIVVIDDAAQSGGATLDGRPVGSLGDLGVLSFGRGKGRTGGRGGALLSLTPRGTGLLDGMVESTLPEAPWGAQASSAAKLGVQWLLGRPALYGLPAAMPWLGLGETHFKSPQPPAAMGGLAAGVLLAGWQEAAAEVEVRRISAERWMGSAMAAGIRPVTVSSTARPGWLRFPIVLSPERYSDFDAASVRRLGVAAGYPTSLADLAGFADHLVQGGDLPGASKLSRSLVTLPTHRLLSAADCRSLVRLLA